MVRFEKPTEPDGDKTWVKREESWMSRDNIPWDVIEGGDGPIRYADDRDEGPDETVVVYYVRVPINNLEKTVEVEDEYKGETYTYEF